jgi:hypothetical protein
VEASSDTLLSSKGDGWWRGEFLVGEAAMVPCNDDNLPGDVERSEAGLLLEGTGDFFPVTRGDDGLMLGAADGKKPLDDTICGEEQTPLEAAGDFGGSLSFGEFIRGEHGGVT